MDPKTFIVSLSQPTVLHAHSTPHNEKTTYAYAYSCTQYSNTQYTTRFTGCVFFASFACSLSDVLCECGTAGCDNDCLLVVCIQ